VIFAAGGPDQARAAKAATSTFRTIQVRPEPPSVRQL
jgi:hypothetical protein